LNQLNNPVVNRHEKGEIVCHTCDNVEVHEKKMYKCWLSDFGGKVFSGLILRSQTKAHSAVCTKRHAGNLREITRQEWSDILPVLKDTISKIDKVYKPMGYRFSFRVGKLGSQNSPFFYMRIVPKYKKDNGVTELMKSLHWTNKNN